MALLFVAASGIYQLGYNAGWDANEKTLVNAWIKYYDVDKKGTYWDNKKEVE